jgi:type II secretory pathway pseudopilin PulG
MKSKRNLAIIICVTAIPLLCFLLAFDAARKNAQEINTTQNIQKLGLALETYSADHGNYPSSLEELSAQSDTETRNSLNQILHDSRNHNYGYQPKTNGFMIVVTSPDGWLGKGDHYLVEFEESTNHSLLKINGAKSTEIWTK